jgi:hypothetical protein
VLALGMSEKRPRACSAQDHSTTIRDDKKGRVRVRTFHALLEEFARLHGAEAPRHPHAAACPPYPHCLRFGEYLGWDSDHTNDACLEEWWTTLASQEPDHPCPD